ncbi:SO2930 family diheme c-type cytochrome [Maricaulis sp. D1M11]|uniref:SO2930 family diheme c-type cytochrome n=1 Tax=Maricaulis sp. D1M11 TaxID=3076117 RepID=UPI0039B4065A
MSLLSRSVSALAALLASVGLSACQPQYPEPAFHATENPPLLSQWGQVERRGAHLVLGRNVQPYDLNSGLFTDDALKLRTVWMPAGLSARYRTEDVLDFPVGTVITKTFYYTRAGQDDDHHVRVDVADTVGLQAEGLDLSEVRLLETRILVHRETGWAALPYRWNADQSEARLHRIGDIIPLTLTEADGTLTEFHYVMPDANQCASCHAPDSNTRIINPIGPKPRHLNRNFPYRDGVANQLSHLAALGWLDGLPGAFDMIPQNAVWTDTGASLEDRARAYLDINCSHCHSPVGPADTSGLFLTPDTPHGPSLGLCKLPIAAGGGTGNRPYDITPGEPDLSILVYRMDSIHADEMMPEIGRSTVDEAGVALVRDWIESLDGTCG